MKKVIKNISKLLFVFLVVFSLSSNMVRANNGFVDNPLGAIPQGEEKVGQVLVSIEDMFEAPAGETVNKPTPLGVILKPVWIDIYPSDSMVNAIVRATNQAEIEVDTWEGGTYISKIAGLAEFDRGMASGWMGTLNDWFTNTGFFAQTVANNDLEDGDTVKIMYTVTGYGEDLGGTWNNNDKSIKKIDFSKGDLNVSFDSKKHDYELYVPKGTQSIIITPTATNKNFQVRTSVDGVEYKRTKQVPISDGKIISVKCGDPQWPTMNDAENDPAEVYTFKVIEKSAVEVSDITIDKTNLTLNINQSYALKASVLPIDATDKSLTFSSDNSSVASVDATGKIVAKAGGKTTIRVKSENGISKEVSVSVNYPTYRTLSSKGVTTYQRYIGNKYVTYRTIGKSGTRTTTNNYRYSNNRNYLSNSTIVQRYKNKNITIYKRSISYYGNNKVKQDITLKRNLLNRKTGSLKTSYYSNGKKSRYVRFTYQKNGRNKARYEYQYNRAGQNRSNKYGKAYYYVTTYNSKGKATKTMRKQYNAKGKALKSVKVKKRVFF